MTTTRSKPHGVALPNLREWRLSHTLSQFELAHKAGIGGQTISNIEVGKRASYLTIYKIAKALDITVDQLRFELPSRR